MFFVKKFFILLDLLTSINYLDQINCLCSKLLQKKIVIIDSLFQQEQKLKINFASFIEQAKMKKISQKKAVFQQIKMQINSLVIFQSKKLTQKMKKNQKEVFMATLRVQIQLDHEDEFIYQSFWFYSILNQKRQQKKQDDYSAEIAKNFKITQDNLPLNFLLVLLIFSLPLLLFPLSHFSYDYLC